MRSAPHLKHHSLLPAIGRGAWLWCGLILAVSSVRAQSDPIGTNPRISQYVHSSWTVDQGLPQNSVYDVEQTPDGYLWIGTQDGLVRFDGVRFEILNKSDGLGNNEVRALLSRSDGSLWIGTNGGGVSRLQGGNVVTYNTGDGLSSDFIRVLFEDSQKNLWIGTIEGGLIRYDGSSFEAFSTDDGLAGDVVLSIEETSDGAIWIGTEAGLSSLVDGSFTNYTTADGLPGSLVWALEADRSGNHLWVGSSGGLARVQDGVVRAVNDDSDVCTAVVEALHEDAAGALWIGTFKNGLCRYQGGMFENFSSAEGLIGSRVKVISSDREGNLWVGTESGGLNRLRRGKFIQIAAAEGLSDDMAFTVMEDDAGRLWIGTKNDGLNLVRDGEVHRITAETGLPSDHIYALARGAEGSIWIGMYAGGLCRLHDGRLSCLDVGDGLLSDNVYAVYEDRRGTVWIGTDAGLSTLSGGRISSIGDAILAKTPITVIHEDRLENIWVGAYGGGLSRIRGHEVTRFSKDTGFVDANVLVLHEDAAGAIWAGTQGGGLCRIQGEKAACLTAANGLPGDNFLQILEDNDGQFWLGTMQGIVSVSLDRVVDVLEGRSDQVDIVEYGKADGLKGTELNGGTQPAAWKSRDGRLWFATNHGVAVIDPAKIRSNTIPPPVIVESIAVNGKPRSLDGSIVLTAGSRDLTFQYTGLSFTAPEKVRFQYKLEGYDETWIDAGTRREAYYTNLAPGDYRFHVKAANSDGVWNDTGASVSFYLEPYFYQTWWFKLLAIVAVLLAALVAYRLRIRQLKVRERELERVVDERTSDLRREKEITEEAKRVIEGQAEKLRELDRFKTRFFANVSHEFRTPLTMIIGPLENMLTSAREPVSGAARPQLEMMLRNALRLMRLINQLLDLSKLEDGKMQLRARPRNVVPFVEGIVASCSSLADGKKLSLTFNSDADEIPLCFEPDKLEKVFYNLLSNASKFTPVGGAISVSIAQEPAAEGMPDGVVVLEFRDSGKGIPPEELPWIFDRFHQVDGSNTREHEGTGIGLALAKELVLLHHGTIDVSSDVGKGTVFTVRLPKGQSHLKPDQLSAELEDEAPDLENSAFQELGDAGFDTADAGDTSDRTKNAADESAPLILVVDDNKDVREYVASIFSDSYRVVTARNGEEGLSRAMEVLPDLILSDVMMPKMDGNELCHRVKTTPELDHIPVVLLTARATHQLKLEGLEMGADDYIPKPFNAHELQVRVKNLLRLRHQEKELKELNDDLEEKVQQQFDQLVQERRQYEEELILSKERAEASDRLKSTILNNLSHEFRTPLTAITGFLQIIESEAPDDLREFTAEIERGSMRLLRTLDSLLQLSRIEADAVGTRREPVDLTATVAGVVDRSIPSAQAKGLRLHLVRPDEEIASIDADRAAVEEVLDNLIDNALKFTSAGEITVTLGRTDDEVYVAVRDTGIGINDEFLPRMFDAFVQESDGLTRSYEGCGLGLTIARRLVELMDGTINVDTEPGTGTTFTVSFPARVTAPV